MPENAVATCSKNESYKNYHFVTLKKNLIFLDAFDEDSHLNVLTLVTYTFKTKDLRTSHWSTIKKNSLYTINAQLML